MMIVVDYCFSEFHLVSLLSDASVSEKPDSGGPWGKDTQQKSSQVIDSGIIEEPHDDPLGIYVDG